MFRMMKRVALVICVLLLPVLVLAYTVAYEALVIVLPPVVYVVGGILMVILIFGGIGLIFGGGAVGFEMVRTRIAQLRGQRVEFEANAQMLLAGQKLMTATIGQIKNGLIHPAQLPNGTTFSSFPPQIVNQLQAGTEAALLPLPLPDRVDLSQLLTETPSLDRLVLGVTANNEIVTESLRNLTHVAVAGVTRFGKSIFIQQLLYQIATAQEETELYLADLGGTTFIDFGLPYASTLGETEEMISRVMAEAEKRKALYEATGRGIRSLDIYNEVTGSDLPWIVMIVDEALYLMEKSKIVKENLEIAVSWAAKYGITAVIISQDFKANVISTATRNNFSSRFQFLAEDQTQANILVKGCDAHHIQQKGRCFARLPGNNTITELQTPYVSEAQIMAIAPHIKTEPKQSHAEPTPTESETLTAWEQIRNDPDFSGSKLYREVTGSYSRPSAKQLEKFRVLLRKFNQNPNF